MPPKKRFNYAGGRPPPPPAKRMRNPQIPSPDIALPPLPPEYRKRSPKKSTVNRRNRSRIPGSRRNLRELNRIKTQSPAHSPASSLGSPSPTNPLISFTKLSHEFLHSPEIKKQLKKLCFRLYAEHPAQTKWLKAKAVGQLIGKHSKTVLKWVNGIAENQEFASQENRGGFRPSTSLLNDEEFQQSLTRWVRTHSIQKGAANMTILSFTHHVNSTAIPNFWKNCGYSSVPPRIVEGTARRWLYRMGFEAKKRKRGIYIDGHDTEENIQARLNFCTKLKKLMLRAPLWITRRQIADYYEFEDISLTSNFNEEFDEILPIDQFPDVNIRKCNVFNGLGGAFHPSLAQSQKKPIIFYSHDESIFHANEDQNSFWSDGEVTGLAKKSPGAGIMISDFKCEVGSGSLSFTESEYQIYLENRRNPDSDGFQSFYPPRHIPYGPLPEPLPQTARVILEYGISKQGYWTNDLFVRQMKVAMEIHDLLYPDFQAVFFIDHSSGHHKFPEYGLVAHRMNRSPEGKQPFMRNGIGRRGAEAICRERNLYREGMTLVHMVTALSNQEDFRNQKTIVEEQVEEKGHKVMFLPKYHCELNFIEMNWAKAKRKTRELCDYSFISLKKNVPKALDEITVSECRAWARKSRDYMAAYLEGTPTQEAEKMIKLYKSHRKVYLPVNMGTFS